MNESDKSVGEASRKSFFEKSKCESQHKCVKWSKMKGQF